MQIPPQQNRLEPIQNPLQKLLSQVPPKEQLANILLQSQTLRTYRFVPSTFECARQREAEAEGIGLVEDLEVDGLVAFVEGRSEMCDGGEMGEDYSDDWERECCGEGL